ncbi:MAG: hypothetical protein V3W34_19385 [Phycisphaerae bacterium]
MSKSASICYVVALVLASSATGAARQYDFAKGGYEERPHCHLTGGSLMSRCGGAGLVQRGLNKAIRVAKGLTYGAHGGLHASHFAARFVVSTFTETPTTAEALQVILDESDRIRATPPETEEVEATKSYRIGSFTGKRETPRATVNDLWLIEYDDLPEDYLSRYVLAVKKMSPDVVARDARRLFQRDKLVIVVVGEASMIKAGLEKIAPTTVVTPVDVHTQESQQPELSLPPPTLPLTHQEHPMGSPNVCLGGVASRFVGVGYRFWASA